jgi:hypothetical protein
MSPAVKSHIPGNRRLRLLVIVFSYKCISSCALTIISNVVDFCNVAFAPLTPPVYYVPSGIQFLATQDTESGRRRFVAFILTCAV